MASTTVGHPYADKEWSEIVPEFLKQPQLRKASIVQDRVNVRYVPQGGQQYTQAGPSMMNLIMSDSSRFLDPNSARLSGSFKIPAGANPNLQLCDGITSLFKRWRVLVNGNMVEDINFCNTKTAMEVYASMPLEHYQTQASALGLFNKFDTKFASLTADVPGIKSLAKNQVGARRANVAASQHLIVNGTPVGVQFSLPLSYISGFFRQSKAFPLLFAGQLQLIIDFDASGGLKSGTSGDVVQWTIDDLSLECDMLQMNPLYTEAFASLVRSPDGGYKLPYTTHMVQQVSVQQGSGTKAVAIPNSVSNIRQISYVIQPTADLSDLSKDKTRFPINGYVDGYVQIGSKRLPEHPCTGVARALALTLDADNELANIGCSPILDIQNYCGVATNGATANDPDAEAFIYSVSCDKVKDTYLPLDGLESTSGLITVYVNNILPSNSTMTVVVETTRFLSMENGMISIA